MDDSMGWVASARQGGRRARGSVPRLFRLVSIGLALALGACGGTSSLPGASSPSGTEPASNGVTAANAGTQGDAPAARPALRVQPRAAPGEVEHFSDPERVKKIVTLAEQQRGQLEADLRALGAPGVAWGLVVDGNLVQAGAEGTTALVDGAPVATHTLFRIGSITKVFTAQAILQLRDRGQLSLDAPMRDWMPELDGVLYLSADSALITPRHLLLHRSGLPRLGNFDYTAVEKPPTEEEVLRALDGVALQHVPGQVSEYSNFGYSVLGLLITRVTKQPFERYISEQVMRPLGMAHSVWHPEEAPPGSLARPHATDEKGQLAVVPDWRMGASSADGGIYSSVDDLARFVSFQLEAWPASSRAGGDVLARSTLRDAQGFQAVSRLRVNQRPEQKPGASVSGEGLGWAVYRDCRFELVTWHNGGTEGHRAALYLLPTRGVGVVLLANRNRVDLDSIALRWLERLHDGGVLPERQRTLVLDELWKERVNATFELAKSFEATRYEALFHPIFRARITAVQMQVYLAEARRRGGECRIGAALPGRDDDWTAARLECADGAGVVEARLMPNGQLVGFKLYSEEAYGARLSSQQSACD
jgi:CubicO group peptidase (beta-lactamase class C family)